MEIEQKIAVSIDLGSSNIKAAVYDSTRANSKIRMLTLSDNQYYDHIPSIIYIGEKSFEIGDFGDPVNQTMIRGFKRHIEEENWNIFIPHRKRFMDVDEILLNEFEWIKKRIAEGCPCEPSDVIITVPVGFSEMQKYRMKKAGETAGLKIREIITEPFAGMFFNLKMLQEDKDDDYNILVFDFGGGTLDMSLFNINKKEKLKISAHAAMGIKFGGEDLTEIILEKKIINDYSNLIEDCVNDDFKRNFLDSEFISDEDKSPNSDAYKKYYAKCASVVKTKLLNEVEKLKSDVCTPVHMKSEPDEEEIFCSSTVLNLNDKNISLSYNEFVEFIKSTDIREKIEKGIELMCDHAMLDVTDITKVMVIGGTSKIAYFRNLLKEILQISDEAENKAFIEVKDRDKFNAVALGALSYFEYNNVEFEAKNILAYEIGTIQDGEYIRLRTDMTTLGTTSLMVGIKPTLDGDGIYKAKMYQIFPGIDGVLTPEEKIKNGIYMGYFSISKDLMPENGRCLIDLCADNKCELYANIYNNSGERILENIQLTH